MSMASIAALAQLTTARNGRPQRGEYVRDDVTTNGIESVCAVMKRGLHGVYHHASEKHLHRYVDEFAFRLNEGNVKRHTMERLESFVEACWQAFDL